MLCCVTHATPVVARIACTGRVAITFAGVIPITAIFLFLVFGTVTAACLDFVASSTSVVACISLDV